MKKYQVRTVKQPTAIRVSVPGSKSITNRALLMAAMSDGKTVLEGVQFSQDSRHFLKALQELGFTAEVSEEKCRVVIQGEGGSIPRSQAEIYVGSAGTAARFLTAFAAMGNGEYILNSSEQMKKRPMRELLEVLEQLGAEITCLEQEGTFPLKIRGIGHQTGRTAECSLNIDRSSQFLSALLMVLPLRFERVQIHLTGMRSARSYVEMTEQMMKQFGHPGVRQIGDNCYEVVGGGYRSQKYQIEPDVSAACYFYAMAAITGGTAVVRHMRRDSLQGDMQFLKILEQMGCRIQWQKTQDLTGDQEELVLQGPSGGRLKGIEAVFSDFSDQTLTMAAIAPFADAPVTVRGVGHIRGQESDRIQVILNELGRMGIRCEESEDGFTVYPGKPVPAQIHTYEDHRVAMAFAVTGLRVPGLEILDPDCCSKTFAEYFRVLDEITAD